MMPRPITESQFSNNILVSGDGKPLTVHQETHFVESNDRLPSNERRPRRMRRPSNHLWFYSGRRGL